MRIGELAALAGVTPRAVRHYHHQGLLPEPPRRPNGYRVYGVRHAVVLARIRRLTELGLGLDEVRDVLADDAGAEVAVVLRELDDDLARQETEIRRRRERLGELLAQAEAGTLPAEGPLPPALAGLLGALPVTDSPSAAKDRAHLTLLAGDGRGDAVLEALAPVTQDPRVPALYERLDALADAPLGDPRIGPLADELAAAVPDAVIAAIPAEGPVAAAGAYGDAMLADFAPAQAAVVRRVMELLAERMRR
ncbi:MerR family transcriptional regulator [Streptomyces agglomeratus]|uniref:MerR family transcriptional regulator n=1 Tax=Streptomyces agglomeratus TaxID=285458 RepID=UPI000854433D|nr:MerR family transcriptional regulator [Streptomyces agglomeratus]OEJ51361.1 MerR family transcriptional regulator [Streptomyces agglomeratus]